MIMWKVEDGGGSACYAMGRKAVIVDETAGYGFNREPEWLIWMLIHGWEFMHVYAELLIIVICTSTIGDTSFPG